jgi:2-oxoglutarate ferredoxin oxidoreductase subunit gamma
MRPAMNRVLPAAYALTCVNKMMQRYEIRLSGEGGQGLVLAGAVLAEAVGIHGGRQVTYTQSYGPESRGGSCRCDIVVSDEQVDYPICNRLDLLLALTQKACDAYGKQLKSDGLLIVDENRVSSIPAGSFRVCRLPILQTARVKLAKEVVANMVCVGIVGLVSGLASKENLTKTVFARVPKGTHEINRRALEHGFTLASAWLELTANDNPACVTSPRISETAKDGIATSSR